MFNSLGQIWYYVPWDMIWYNETGVETIKRNSLIPIEISTELYYKKHLFFF